MEQERRMKDVGWWRWWEPCHAINRLWIHVILNHPTTFTDVTRVRGALVNALDSHTHTHTQSCTFQGNRACERVARVWDGRDGRVVGGQSKFPASQIECKRQRRASRWTIAMARCRRVRACACRPTNDAAWPSSSPSAAAAQHHSRCVCACVCSGTKRFPIVHAVRAHKRNTRPGILSKRNFRWRKGKDPLWARTEEKPHTECMRRRHAREYVMYALLYVRGYICVWMYTCCACKSDSNIVVLRCVCFSHVAYGCVCVYSLDSSATVRKCAPPPCSLHHMYVRVGGKGASRRECPNVLPKFVCVCVAPGDGKHLQQRVRSADTHTHTHVVIDDRRSSHVMPTGWMYLPFV